MSQGRGSVLGVSDMAEVTAERLRNAQRAARVIEAARGTERYGLREPDDARIAQMLAVVASLAAQLGADDLRRATT